MTRQGISVSFTHNRRSGRRDTQINVPIPSILTALVCSTSEGRFWGRGWVILRKNYLGTITIEMRVLYVLLEYFTDDRTPAPLNLDKLMMESTPKQDPSELEYGR